MRSGIILAIAGLLAACGAPAPEVGVGPSLSGILADADIAEFDRALESRPLQFPADHYAHPRFKTEWWYFTGNLDSDEGEAFGFQLTFFRFALAPSLESRGGWDSQAVWMGHLAVTDVERAAFYNAERFSRDGLELAGNARAPFRLWLEDWSTTGIRDGPFPLTLSAADSQFGIELVLDDAKGAIAHGQDGLDRKGAEPGNASYYYSMPRLPAVGEIRIGERVHRVSGEAWMDREWSSNALDPTLAGWDWLALQLSDGSDLMLYRLRTKEGAASEFSTGTWIGDDGGVISLASEDFEMRPIDRWTSPDSGSRYPIRWTVTVPSLALDLDIDAAIANQEMNLAVRYWEGAVSATGTRDGSTISGRGYLELTGY
jgi:predicted secreted hydrolase